MAKINLNEATKEAEANARRAEAALEAKKRALDLASKKLSLLGDQLKVHKIVAPRDGRVRSLEGAPIKKGSNVRPRQPLLRLIPNEPEEPTEELKENVPKV